MTYKIGPYCLKFMLITYLMLVCLLGKSQYAFNEVDKLLLANQKQLGNEVAALIYKDGKLVYQKELGEEFKVKTPAPIGSASAWLTAALVMTFVDEGKLSLDEKVSTYLPIYATYGKSYITIRQCLSHQTGIADNQKSIGKLFERKKFESLEEEVESYAKKEIAANPGNTFTYGSMGINIAGRVLEVVSKKRFELLVKQRLFTPLNMKKSSFSPEGDVTDPSGGAVSTAADFMNFLSMLLDKGMFGGKKILSEQSVKELLTIHAKGITKKYVPKTAEGYEYGLGAWVQESSTQGESTVISAPAFYGTLPFIDKCRNYACILFVSKLLDEQKPDFYVQLKKAIDRQIPGPCN